MFNHNKKNLFKFLILFTLFLLFTKIDYRLKSDLYCCNDDHDYYSHAVTTVIDIDFDYTNQFIGNEKSRNYINNKTAPIGFYGTGLLGSPFLFIGEIIDRYVNLQNELGYSHKVLMYSFSSIFFLLLTFKILIKIKKLLNFKLSNIYLLIIFLGTGLPYYAFERYSMTHVYDTFAITLLVYFLANFYTNGAKKFTLLIAITNLLVLVIRWTNYQIILLPIIIQKLFFTNSKYRLRNDKLFISSSIFTLFVFLIHTKLIWGIYTINPRRIYNQHEFVSEFVNQFFQYPLTFIKENLFNFFTTLLTQEFGVIWFSPIIFIGFISSLYIFLKNKFISIALVSIFGYYFSLVNIWKSTGSAYGFRYTYPLITISILLFLFIRSDKPSFKIIEVYLIIFSIFSLISVLFFEGWEGTQLSLNAIENSFGKYEKFVNPDYLRGLIIGFSKLEAYLKIFTTSFLGLIIFKLLVTIVSISNLNIFLSKLGLPVDNSDFQSYLVQVLNLKSTTLLILIATFIFFTYLIKEEIWES